MLRLDFFELRCMILIGLVGVDVVLRNRDVSVVLCGTVASYVSP